MSDLHNTRLPSPAWRASLAAALCTDCTYAVEPVSWVVPVQIVAAPDRDTLKLADSRAGGLVRVSNLLDNRNHIQVFPSTGRCDGGTPDPAGTGGGTARRTHADSVS